MNNDSHHQGDPNDGHLFKHWIHELVALVTLLLFIGNTIGF